jgi:signal peptide peptidase SppA
LATRVFCTPLLIERHKLDVILAAIAPRVGIAAEQPEPTMYGPGDKGPARKPYYVTGEGIAVIDIMGPLVKRQSGAFMSGGPTTYSEIETEFRDALANPDVKGVMLQIDSPGGETAGAFELADLVYAQRGTKPIYASADSDAFSAAFLIGSAAERLYVTRSGGVGSVGVWMLHVDLSAWNEKQGVAPTYIFAGARKIDGNPDMPLSDEARNAFQTEVDRLYGMFVNGVARNRQVSAEAIRKTEAGLYFGANAVNAGFADQVGTFSEAMAGLRDRVKSGRGSISTAASRGTGAGKPGSTMDSPLVKACETLLGQTHMAGAAGGPLAKACDRLAGSGAEGRL